MSKAGKVTQTTALLRVSEIEKREVIFKNRGGRHSAAEQIAGVAPDALVVVVSENGGISLLARGVKDPKKDVCIDL